MTFEASRLTVLAITAPQPSWKALAITFRLVPGGPDAMINGLGSLSPSTVIDRVGILLFPFSVAKQKTILRCFRRNFKPHGTKVPSSPGTAAYGLLLAVGSLRLAVHTSARSEVNPVGPCDYRYAPWDHSYETTNPEPPASNL